MRTEKSESMGEFWLPEKPDAKVHGTLTIEEGGLVRLKTVGLLAEQLDLMNWRVTGHARIIGRLHGGEAVTLEDTFYWRRPSFGIPPTTALEAKFAFIGLALDGNADATFNSIIFTTDCLSEWHQKTGISCELDESENPRKTTIRYEAIDDVVLWSEAGKRLELTFEWNLSDVGPGALASVTQYSSLRFSSDERIPVEELTRTVHRIQHFLSFAVGATVSISAVFVGSCDHVTTPEARKTSRPVRLYYHCYPFTEKPADIGRSSMPLPFPSIESVTQSVFSRWFSVYERAGKALGLYWGALNDSAKYIDGRFLFIIQALEVFHRLTSAETVLSKDAHRALFKTLIKACPAEYRELIAPRLRYAHELSLSTRLQRMVDPFAVFFDEPAFLQKVVRTRNYFTHWDPKSKEMAATDDELWPICAKLEALFSLLLMREIGLSSDTIAHLVESNRELKRRLGYRLGEKPSHAS